MFKLFLLQILLNFSALHCIEFLFNSFASELFLISVEQNLLLLFCRKSELYSTKIVRLEKILIFFSFSFFSSNGNYVSTKNMI